jgi:hypothetical protein
MQQKYNCIDAALQQIAWAAAFEVQHIVLQLTPAAAAAAISE